VGDISDPQRVNALLWGPIKTTIGETVGEFVDVVRNDNKDKPFGLKKRAGIAKCSLARNGKLKTFFDFSPGISLFTVYTI